MRHHVGEVANVDYAIAGQASDEVLCLLRVERLAGDRIYFAPEHAASGYIRHGAGNIIFPSPFQPY
jgi:hypothetical protein